MNTITLERMSNRTSHFETKKKAGQNVDTTIKCIDAIAILCIPCKQYHTNEMSKN